MARAISNSFLKEFLEGSLAELLEEIHNDTTLIMELRGNKVDIYYRGGALFTITETGKSYEIYHNPAYWTPVKKYDELIVNPSPEDCIKYIALYKHQMDCHRAIDPELEAQSQQQLVLENNVLGKGTTSTGDYFILDIEYAYKEKGEIDARFDAIGLKWPSTAANRRKREALGITFFEMKYYDRAMKGKAGIQKHINDYRAFIKTDAFNSMCRDMERVFYQKCLLGLIPAYKDNLSLQNDKDAYITIDDNNVDFVFLFSNRDPDSTLAKAEFSEAFQKYGESGTQDIYVAKASEVGYVLFRYISKGKGNNLIDRYIPIKEYIQT